MDDTMGQLGIRHGCRGILPVLFLCLAVSAGTLRLDSEGDWQPVASEPRQEYLHAVAELKDLVRSGDSKAVEAALAQIKDEYPQYAGSDLDLFIQGELHYWKNHYDRAMARFDKLLKDNPASEFAAPVMERQFDIAQAYLGGRKKTVLGFIRISGHTEGVEIMEALSDRAGLEDPNGIGLRAAIAVAESYEAREQYTEAYLKWSEIASYWETGPVGRRALLQMAEDNLSAYNAPGPKRRARFDGSKLTTARTYFERYLDRYPEEAQALDIPEKIAQIDELMATKQLGIGQYYQGVRKAEAARFYFEMVARQWPETEAGRTAAEILAGQADSDQGRER